ncbi:hypothetical protein [Vibrio rotiferianus]|uniref:hypothetical protein n=1 Tax=Vibrio rotiferianus TaxID=190895 RepID=UPI00398126E5
MKSMVVLSMLAFSSNSFGFYSPSNDVVQSNESQNEIKHMTAYISSSQSGMQRVYFDYEHFIVYKKDYKIEVLNDCDNKELKFKNGSSETPFVMLINSQNVKMYASCQVKESGSPYIYFTADTEKGNEYIASTFKRSNMVKVQSYDFGFNVTISAKGFTQAWNSYGGDAI